MNGLWNQFAASLPRFTPTALLDILAVAVLIYQAIMIIRGRRAAHVAVGVAVLLAAYALSVLLGLELFRAAFETLAPFTAFALIVMFQSEIRRLLARIGRRRWLFFGTRLETQATATDILMTVERLVQDQVGALIVVEREIGLRTFTESGVPMDAQLTQELLMAIFRRGAPLHDGAVIVQGSRVVAAACFLPITTNPDLSRDLGTRHRAAIGITEESDALSIVVSEETGRISLAQMGTIRMDVSLAAVAHALGARELPPASRSVLLSEEQKASFDREAHWR
jgi:diadenylate cyclase